MKAAFTISFGLCAVFAVIATVIHFWMMGRLDDAGFPIKWFGTPMDSFDAWSRYYNEAPARQWPLWPYTAVRVVTALFVATAALSIWLLDRMWA